MRRVLERNLPAGTQLQAQHLWLLKPPCDAVNKGVWTVMGLAALTVIAKARKYMWVKHSKQKEQQQRRERADAAAPRRRAPTRRQQADQAPEAPPSVLAAHRAVTQLAEAVWDFVDLGRVPRAWIDDGVDAEHPLIGVRTVADAAAAAPAGERRHKHKLVNNSSFDEADIVV